MKKYKVWLHVEEVDEEEARYRDLGMPEEVGVFDSETAAHDLVSVIIDNHNEDCITIRWAIDDVHSVTGDRLTDNEARAVLARVKATHEPILGVTWETLIAVADELYPVEEPQ